MIQTNIFAVSRTAYFRIHFLLRLLRLWLPFVVFIAIGLFVWYRMHSTYGFTSLGVFFGIYLLMAAFAAYVMTFRYKDESAFAPKRMIVEERQLRVEITGTPTGATPTIYEVPFEAIRSITPFGNHILLYTSRDHFFAVPYSAFSSKEEGLQFTDTIKKEASNR